MTAMVPARMWETVVRACLYQPLHQSAKPLTRCAMADMKGALQPDYPPHVSVQQRKHTRIASYARLLAIGLASVALVAFSSQLAPSSWVDALLGIRHVELGDALCPQLSAIHPTRHAELDEALEVIYETEDFHLDTYEKLGGAVRIP